MRLTFHLPRKRLVTLFAIILVVGYISCQQFQDLAEWKDVASAFTRFESNSKAVPDLLLSVPFYVYEEAAWENATLGGKPFLHLYNGVLKDFPYLAKHTADVYILRAALRHPMRTHNPEEAKLFVIPILLNTFLTVVFKNELNLCWNNTCGQALFGEAANRIQQAGYTERPHFVVNSHWGFPRKKTQFDRKLLHLLYHSHELHFENKKNNAPSLQSYPALHVGQPCPMSDTKPWDVTFTASLHPERPWFRERRQLCEWLEPHVNQTHNLSTTSIRIPHCGAGVMCPALAEAKLTFHVRGDTMGSQRVMDSILSGTVPIFTHREQYEILPQWVDWERLTYLIDFERTKTAQQLEEQLVAILKNETEYEAKHQAVLEHRQFFNWSTLYPFDTYMYMLQAELYPETRIQHSKWSALKLP